LRFAVFYGPVWFFIVLTLAIYIRTGGVIWERRRQLNRLGNLDSADSNTRYEGEQTAEHVEGIEMRDPERPIERTHTRATEIRVTSEITRSQQGYYPTTEELCNPISPFYNPYSVTIEGGFMGRQNSILPLKAVKHTHSESWGRRRAMSDTTNTAAWAYTKYAMLFFIALLVTWVCTHWLASWRYYG
jgi:hypothetical protein